MSGSDFARKLDSVAASINAELSAQEATRRENQRIADEARQMQEERMSSVRRLSQRLMEKELSRIAKDVRERFGREGFYANGESEESDDAETGSRAVFSHYGDAFVRASINYRWPASASSADMTMNVEARIDRDREVYRSRSQIVAIPKNFANENAVGWVDVRQWFEENILAATARLLSSGAIQRQPVVRVVN